MARELRKVKANSVQWQRKHVEGGRELTNDRTRFPNTYIGMHVSKQTV